MPDSFPVPTPDTAARPWTSELAWLWQTAWSEHPTDHHARAHRYYELMVEHGHIVPAKPEHRRNTEGLRGHANARKRADS